MTTSPLARAAGAVALAGTSLLAHAGTPAEQRLFDLSSHIADASAPPKYVGKVTETANARAMQLQLRAGQAMERHSSDGAILLHMTKGEAVFTFDQGAPVTVRAGQLLRMAPNEAHAVRVIADMEALVIRVHP